MTFNFAPWAVDGARTGAALARTATRASTGGRSGVVSPLDLRVLPLEVNGNGIRITSGSSVIVNGYQTDPDEAYVVSNPATHTVLPADMPAANPATSYYLVCVVVGDPFFDQSDHPYMPSTPLTQAEALDYEYVRVVIVPCSAGTTRFEDLGYNYPAYALARLEIPPNTTTITTSMIVDLRDLAQPRTSSEVLVGQPVAATNLSATAFATWTDYQPTIKVPHWATHASVVLHISGALHVDPEAQGAIRVALGGVLVGPSTSYAFDDSNSAGNAERVSLLAAASGRVDSVAGTSQTLVVQGYKDPTYLGYLSTYAGQTHVFDVRFYERIL